MENPYIRSFKFSAHFTKRKDEVRFVIPSYEVFMITFKRLLISVWKLAQDGNGFSSLLYKSHLANLGRLKYFGFRSITIFRQECFIPWFV